MEQLLTIAQVAEYIGAPIRSVRYCIKKGTIPAIRFSRKICRISKTQLDAVIESGGLKALEAPCC